MWNKIGTLIVLIISTCVLVTSIGIEARGGGGGGRGSDGSRSGGGHRGGHTVNRTPSMSRTSSRPSHSSQARRHSQSRPSTRAAPRSHASHRTSSSQTRNRPQTSSSNRTPSMSRSKNRPSSSQVKNRAQTRPSRSRSDFQNVRRTSQKPSAANRAELRNQVNRYAKDKPRQKVDRKDRDQRVQNFSKNRENQVIQNRQVSDRISKRLHQSHQHYNQWFDRNFFDHHHLDLDYLGTRANWWRPAAWGTLASWGTWQWSIPYYYDEEGYYYPVTVVEPTYVYPRTTIVYPYSTTTTPSLPVQQSTAESTEIPATSEEEWLPLGVFAVTNNAVNATEETNLFIQLAINREGEIAGVLYNSETGEAQDITGTVNTKSQKAYWLMADRTDSPIASTGIYNLTEDQTPINVHFSDGSEQTWTLVRIKQEQ